jgi:nicotianamine synthase
MTAETALEQSWSSHFLMNNTGSWSDVQAFQYFSCYAALTALEMQALPRATTPVLFIGGGPLPLSVLIMAHDYGQAVRVIDKDEAAVASARALTEKLQLNHLVECIHVDAHTYVPTETRIIMAAMVGQNDAEKSHLRDYLYRSTSVDTVVLARGVQGLAELLYVPHTLSTPWVQTTTMTEDCVINTVHVWKKS